MPLSSMPSLTPHPPASLLTDQHLREWWAALFALDVLPARQTIRAMRGCGLPYAKIQGKYLYDPDRVWQWIQEQMISVNHHHLAVDAARAHMEALSLKSRGKGI